MKPMITNKDWIDYKNKNSVIGDNYRFPWSAV